MTDSSEIINCLQSNDSDEILVLNLNQLSIKLRNSDERKSEQVYDYIENILTEDTSSGKCQIGSKSRDFLFDFMKVLVNFVAYNDKNRLMVSKKLINFIDLLNDEILEDRFLIFLDNLMIGEDSNEVLVRIYENMNSNNLLSKLYDIIVYKLDKCSTSQNDWRKIKKLNFLIDFFKRFYTVVISSNANNKTVNFKETKVFQFKRLVGIISLIESNSSNDDSDNGDNDDDDSDDDDDESILSNYAFFLNLESERLDIENVSTDGLIIQDLFKIFPNDFEDKQLSRFFFGSIGNVSSHLRYDNHQDIQFCLDMIKDSQSVNPYLISLAFLILGNSIESSENRDLLFLRQSNLIDIIFTKFELLNVDNYFKKIIIEKQICKEINFITEPILQQSVFQLLKLIFTPNQMKDEKILAMVQSDLENHFETLSKIILINFNSVFFSRINLQIILKLLNNLVRNFVNYNKEKSANLNNLKWFIRGSREVIVSLLKSIKLDISYSSDTIIEIKECNEISKGLIFEFLQNLLNDWINLELPRTFEEDLFNCLFDIVLQNGVQVEDEITPNNNSITTFANPGLSITGSQDVGDSKVSKKGSGMVMLLSQKLITLTLVVASLERYSSLSEYPIQAIIDDSVEKAIAVIDEDRKIDQQCKHESKMSGTNMLSNNLKVFLVTCINTGLTCGSGELHAAVAKYKSYLAKLV